LDEYDDIPSIINYPVDKLFIDSDFGANKYIIKRISAKINIVYEEGFGTYRHKYLDSNILNIKYRLKNLATFIGGCSLTDEVIVYFPELYMFSHNIKKKNNVKRFKLSFIENLSKNSKLFKKMFHFNYNYNDLDSNVLLIAGTWGFDESMIDYNKVDLSQFDQIILKSHPNNYEETKYNFDFDYKIINNSIPIEFIIHDLFNKKLKTTLLHTASSAILYIYNYLDSSIDLLSDSDPFKMEYDLLNKYKLNLS
jgi:hypothetical protein